MAIAFVLNFENTNREVNSVNSAREQKSLKLIERLHRYAELLIAHTL